MFADDDLKRVCVNTLSCSVYLWQTLFSSTAATGCLYKIVQQHNSDATFQQMWSCRHLLFTLSCKCKLFFQWCHFLNNQKWEHREREGFAVERSCKQFHTVSHCPSPLPLSPVPSHLHISGPLTLQMKENCTHTQGYHEHSVTTNIARATKSDHNAGEGHLALTFTVAHQL